MPAGRPRTRALSKPEAGTKTVVAAIPRAPVFRNSRLENEFIGPPSTCVFELGERHFILAGQEEKQFFAHEVRHGRSLFVKDRTNGIFLRGFAEGQRNGLGRCFESGGFAKHERNEAWGKTCHL